MIPVIGSNVPGIKDQLETIPNQLFESGNYIELYEKITGNKFEKSDISDINNRVLGNIENIF